MEYKNTPIIINARDRLTCLKALVEWLETHGYHNLTIIDNDSKYPPLLEWYGEVEQRIRVERPRANLGSKALWHRKMRHLTVPPFVYTDCDIVPSEECPDDILALFFAIAEQLPGYKIGPGLRIDDIPEHYRPAPIVRKWEERFWAEEMCSLFWPPRNDLTSTVPCFQAPIDTTFALYTESAIHDKHSYPGIRTGWPYVARHADWYIDSAKPTEEKLYYEGRVSVASHSWGIKSCFNGVVQSTLRRERKIK